jgi:hypothetical protein
MAIFAVLDNNNVVANAIVCESLELAEQLTGCKCLEILNEKPVGIGYTYVNGEFIAPPVEEPTND